MPRGIAAGAMAIEDAGGGARDLRGGPNAPEDGAPSADALVTAAVLRAAAAGAAPRARRAGDGRSD